MLPLTATEAGSSAGLPPQWGPLPASLCERLLHWQKSREVLKGRVLGLRAERALLTPSHFLPHIWGPWRQVGARGGREDQPLDLSSLSLTIQVSKLELRWLRTKSLQGFSGIMSVTGQVGKSNSHWQIKQRPYWLLKCRSSRLGASFMHSLTQKLSGCLQGLPLLPPPNTTPLCLGGFMLQKIHHMEGQGETRSPKPPSPAHSSPNQCPSLKKVLQSRDSLLNDTWILLEWVLNCSESRKLHNMWMH